MAHRNEIMVGVDPNLNNLVVFRKVSDRPFLPMYFFTDEDLLDENTCYIIVSYLEYYKNTLGVTIDALTQTKTYIVRGKKAVDWFLALATTPIKAKEGIIDSIEYILQKELPIGCPTDFELV